MGIPGGNGGNRPQNKDYRPNQPNRGSRPAGARPQSGRPSAPRGSRYAPPSPKRPGRYRRNGISNIAMGGVLIGIILLIVVLIVVRSSCTGCVNGTDSDVSGIGSSTRTSSSESSSVISDSAPPSSDSNSSSTSSFVPPKPAEPVIPVLTLVKNKPVNAFDPDCVVDELQWFNDTKAAGENLRFVYDKLGIQPYVVFKEYDSSLKTEDDKVKYCVEWYRENIDDDDTFLLMYFAEKNSSDEVGYTVYYSGENAEKLAVEFKWILEEGMNEYWFTEMSTDDVIKYAFEYTCDRITVKNEIPSSTSSAESSTSDDSSNTEEPSTMEGTNDTAY